MRKKSRNAAGFAAMAVGAAFIALGVYRGEVGIVLQKAVNICLECIGLG